MSSDYPNEEAIIAEALRRRKLKEPGIPAAKMKVFRKLLRQEYEQTGTLNRENVERLLQQLKNGEL